MHLSGRFVWEKFAYLQEKLWDMIEGTQTGESATPKQVFGVVVSIAVSTKTERERERERACLCVRRQVRVHVNSSHSIS